MVGAVAILGTLMAITTMPNENNNGFVRKWASEETIKPIKSIHLQEDLSIIAGVSDNSIFIAGKSPTGILILNKVTNKKDTLAINLKYPQDKIVPFYIKIDTPKLFLHLNNLETIIDGNFPNSKFRATQSNSGVFMKSVQISDTLALIKTPDTTFKFQDLKIVNLNTGQTIRSTILRNIKGLNLGIANDGMILYDSQFHSIIYVEYFRNRIICLDTNLLIKYESQTIDTISSTSLNLAKEVKDDSTNKYVPSAARKLVNDASIIEQGKLFIISALRADNQDIINFNSNLNIDVYNTNNGEYIHSFQISKHKGKSVNSFIVKADTLYALFEKEINIYSLKSLQTTK